MIKIIHGPTYQYQGETLDQPTLIYVQDHHYNEQDQCFHLQRLLNGSTEHTVVFDHVVQHDEFLSNPVYFPALLAREMYEFNQQNIVPNWTNKTHAFNFMINKPRPHRAQLLSLIDQHWLSNYTHSLCWKQSPVTSVAVTDFRIGAETVMDQGIRLGNYTNACIYQALLQTQVFEPSWVSLVTEPAYYEQETIVTEKTIMAICGGTIPIWVGGWRIADYMRSQGYDVFDDIVDHSYQNLNDPARRVEQAIIRNIDLLKNVRPVSVDRLTHNLDLLKKNNFQQEVNSLIKIYPSLRTVVPT